MEWVTLYYHEESEIKISIEAYFENEMLVIDGYDIGPSVKEYWGDSDYEYSIKVPADGVSFLYSHFNIHQAATTNYFVHWRLVTIPTPAILIFVSYWMIITLKTRDSPGPDLIYKIGIFLPTT